MREEILVNLTNGGPVKVHIRDGKIIRVFPLSFDDNDAASWAINAGGRKFSPPRKACTPPFTMSEKARIYSDARIKYPLLREDFSPDGDRHPETRGGCVNILVPERLMSKNVPGMAPNSCLVEIARWEG
jgi:trimethylamine-N-oxide reductase (cytochrome c)